MFNAFAQGTPKIKFIKNLIYVVLYIRMHVYIRCMANVIPSVIPPNIFRFFQIGYKILLLKSSGLCSLTRKIRYQVSKWQSFKIF